MASSRYSCNCRPRKDRNRESSSSPCQWTTSRYWVPKLVWSIDGSQTVDNDRIDPGSNQRLQTEQSRIVGDYMLLDIAIEGIPATSLIDTGSQVTTLSEKFFKQHLMDQGVTVGPITWLKLTAANGLDVPFSGCVEVNLNISGITIHTVALLVPREPLPGVPCLLEMNTIRQCNRELFQSQDPACQQQFSQNPHHAVLLQVIHQVREDNDQDPE
ncbi:hypothetical protein BSL78_09835 [Apostichopus japonicus]|uniref:Peptidase A2 domain-containing protein n=1 Tax=Stichopus japonicus TaxID=307972 RepID=A0A2G8KZ42_STIJA|nr:hypothetical protein BSL78_09835 [Apostichopus japonicus]